MSVDTLRDELQAIASNLPVGQLHQCSGDVQHQAKRVGELSLTTQNPDLLPSAQLILDAAHHIDAAAHQLLDAATRIQNYSGETLG